MSLTAGTRIGSYEIVGSLGAGGMGEVYRARDTKLHREVALKILPEAFATDPERLARFEREAHLLASLNHPNIAQIYGQDEISADHEGPRRIVLVMELVDGETLADRIARGPMPLDEAVPAARQIAEALEAAHEQGIIHRDLKPANIKVRADGTVKVLDFGLAKLVGPPEGGPYVRNVGAGFSRPDASPTITSPVMMTGVGVLLGTAAYMSPEQANGRDADKRSDVWAFGCVLYEMLTGHRPFAGETIAETLASVLKEHPSLDRVPATIRPLVGRCLEKNPRLRLQAIGEARIGLERSANQSIATPPPNALERRRSVWLPWSIAAVFAAIAALALAASFVHRTDPLQVLRYTILGPVDGVMNSFALSPDGRSIAMAVTVGSKRQLWLRALDGFQVRALANTDDAAFPFWSPDGKQIAFFAQGKLKRIAVIGGPAQTIATAADGRAGAWSSDGSLLFADSGGGGADESGSIQRVSAQGGPPVQILKTTGTAMSLALLPGDRGIVYATRDATRGRGVFVAALDGTGNRQILNDAEFAVYAPGRDTPDTGHLLFIRDETLMAQPFDVASGSVSGDAVPVSDGVLIPARGPYTPVTVSKNGVMVYTRSGDAETPTRIVWFDRAGNLTELKDVLGSSPTLSPDGRSFAYMRAPNGRSQVWVRDLASGREIRLTQDDSRNTTPTWSPDGQRLIFRSERGGKRGDLYWRAANGAGRDELLLDTLTNKIPMQWSRDGKYVVYGEGGAPGFGLRVLELTSTNRVVAARAPASFLSDASELGHGQLSPDNRWMAYVAREGGRQEVFVRPFPAVGDDLWKVSTEGGLQPRWRADGKELYFLSVDGKMMAVAVGGAEPSSAQKRGQRFEVGVPVPLFDTHTLAGTTSRAYQYDVTADGSRFIVATTGSSSAPILTVEVNWNAPVE
jgi:eukaryotic-like serine/threonine-protein kinase